jgi:hypothetical protein
MDKVELMGLSYYTLMQLLHNSFGLYVQTFRATEA